MDSRLRWKKFIDAVKIPAVVWIGVVIICIGLVWTPSLNPFPTLTPILITAICITLLILLYGGYNAVKKFKFGLIGAAAVGLTLGIIIAVVITVPYLIAISGIRPMQAGESAAAEGLGGLVILTIITLLITIPPIAGVILGLFGGLLARQRRLFALILFLIFFLVLVVAAFILENRIDNMRWIWENPPPEQLLILGYLTVVFL